MNIRFSLISSILFIVHTACHAAQKQYQYPSAQEQHSQAEFTAVATREIDDHKHRESTHATTHHTEPQLDDDSPTSISHTPPVSLTPYARPIETSTPSPGSTSPETEFRDTPRTVIHRIGDNLPPAVNNVAINVIIPTDEAGYQSDPNAVTQRVIAHAPSLRRYRSHVESILRKQGRQNKELSILARQLDMLTAPTPIAQSRRLAFSKRRPSITDNQPQEKRREEDDIDLTQRPMATSSALTPSRTQPVHIASPVNPIQSQTTLAQADPRQFNDLIGQLKQAIIEEITAERDRIEEERNRKEEARQALEKEKAELERQKAELQQQKTADASSSNKKICASIATGVLCTGLTYFLSNSTDCTGGGDN